jgi:hypothetical protein
MTYTEENNKDGRRVVIGKKNDEIQFASMIEDD